MHCKCGSYMIWNCDYINGVFITWYSCPFCGHDTRNIQYSQTNRTEQYKDKEDKDEK